MSVKAFVHRAGYESHTRVLFAAEPSGGDACQRYSGLGNDRLRALGDPSVAALGPARGAGHRPVDNADPVFSIRVEAGLPWRRTGLFKSYLATIEVLIRKVVGAGSRKAKPARGLTLALSTKPLQPPVKAARRVTLLPCRVEVLRGCPPLVGAV